MNYEIKLTHEVDLSASRSRSVNIVRNFYLHHEDFFEAVHQQQVAVRLEYT